MALRIVEYEIPYSTRLRPARFANGVGTALSDNEKTAPYGGSLAPDSGESAHDDGSAAPDAGKSTRRGLLLQDDSDNRSEIAPLPGFSTESLDEAIAFLQRYRHELSGPLSQTTLEQLLTPETCEQQLRTLPSVRFGLSMLLEQQRANKAGLPLSSWLIASCNGNAKVPANAPISNAILPESNIEQTLHNAKRAIARGYHVLKLKLPPSPEQACEIVQALIKNTPQATLRLDANRQFNEKQALAFQQCLARHGASPHGTPPHGASQHHGTSPHPQGIPYAHIEYVEEPVKEPDPQVFLRLRKAGMRVALDESARSLQALGPYIHSGAVDAVVIKPMLTGTFQEVRDIIFLALGKGTAGHSLSGVAQVSHEHPDNANRRAIIISSSMETSVGRTLLAHLATFVNYWQHSVHGLATGHLLKNDLQLPPGPITQEGISPYILRRIL